MCGRFVITSPPAALRQIFGYLDQPNFPPRYNIAPTQPIPVVIVENGHRHFRLMRWGLLPAWVKDPGQFTLLINARAETLLEKPAFKNAIKRRRCLIPADGYYEWQVSEKRKRPHFIHRRDGAPMGLAGLAETWIGPNGEELDTVAIVTAPASADLAVLHHRVPVTIYVPHGNSVEKNRAMAAFGAHLVEHGDDFQEAREEAGRHAERDGLHMVPSFHPDLVLGVATYALELLRAAPDLDVLYVPIGQGSGICGCILARDLLGLKTEIVGVQSTLAPAYARSFTARTVVNTNSSNTLADGMATRNPDADALALILKGAARIVQVTDEEVAGAIRAYWTDTHNIAEGAGAAPLAAALQEKHRLHGKRVGLVLSGGNIDFDLFRKWVMADSAVAERTMV